MIVRIGIGFVFAIAVIVSITIYRDNASLRRLLSRQQFGVLSPDVRRLVLADLESSDLNRIASWKFYFRHTLALESNLNGRVPQLEELAQLYKSHEHPGRSNYFDSLLDALSVRQRSTGLTRSTLVGHVGKPDESENVSDGEVLRYRFSWYGRDSIALFLVTNDTVLRVGFNVLPDSSANSKQR